MAQDKHRKKRGLPSEPTPSPTEARSQPSYHPLNDHESHHVDTRRRVSALPSLQHLQYEYFPTNQGYLGHSFPSTNPYRPAQISPYLLASYDGSNLQKSREYNPDHGDEPFIHAPSASIPSYIYYNLPTTSAPHFPYPIETHNEQDKTKFDSKQFIDKMKSQESQHFEQSSFSNEYAPPVHNYESHSFSNQFDILLSNEESSTGESKKHNSTIDEKIVKLDTIHKPSSPIPKPAGDDDTNELSSKLVKGTNEVPLLGLKVRQNNQPLSQVKISDVSLTSEGASPGENAVKPPKPIKSKEIAFKNETRNESSHTGLEMNVDSIVDCNKIPDDLRKIEQGPFITSADDFPAIDNHRHGLGPKSRTGKTDSRDGVLNEETNQSSLPPKDQIAHEKKMIEMGFKTTIFLKEGEEEKLMERPSPEEPIQIEDENDVAAQIDMDEQGPDVKSHSSNTPIKMITQEKGSDEEDCMQIKAKGEPTEKNLYLSC